MCFCCSLTDASARLLQEIRAEADAEEGEGEGEGGEGEKKKKKRAKREKIPCEDDEYDVLVRSLMFEARAPGTVSPRTFRTLPLPLVIIASVSVYLCLSVSLSLYIYIYINSF